MNINQDYFCLFGVEKSYYPNMDEVQINYRKLQRQFHPDKFVSATAQEKLLAMQMTSLINDGLRIMKDQVARAEYLLKISGAEPQDESKTMQDLAFLQQQIELREQLDELQSDESKINQFVDNMEKEILKIGKSFAEKIKQDNEASQILLQHLKFYHRLKQQAELKL